MALSNDKIVKQSKQAYGQWAPQWRAQAKEHSKYPMKNLNDFENTGIGKACLVVANGASFERDIETIKEYQDNVDVLACDKTIGHLLDNDITPEFCLVCDANVSYETYLEKYKDKLQDTILFINVCGNPKWTEFGNWKDVYFFVNVDVLQSELEFSKLSGCSNFIPAGTNVSNAMLVFLTQSTNDGRRNFFGYDKYILTGFDYSWTDERYYSFDTNGGGKNNYMRHVFLRDIEQNLVYTSSNLLFSAQWGQQYINTYKIPVVQTTKKTIFSAPNFSTMKKAIRYKHKPEDSKKVINLIEYRKEKEKEIIEIDKKLKVIGEDHFMAVVRSD